MDYHRICNEDIRNGIFCRIYICTYTQTYMHMLIHSTPGSLGYIRTHTYIHTCMCYLTILWDRLVTYVHTHTHTYMHVLTHSALGWLEYLEPPRICIHTYMHTYMHVLPHSTPGSLGYIRTYTHTHTYMNMLTHSTPGWLGYIRTYIHTCMHAYVNSQYSGIAWLSLTATYILG